MGMRKRKLGRTGLEVSQIGFGAIKLREGEVTDEQATEALNTALDLGINFVDTHRGYGDSETKIGRAIAHRRDEFYLATKTHSRDASSLRKDLETSLTELRTERIDLYQFHSVSGEQRFRDVMAPGCALAEARKAQSEGLIDYVGISIHRDLDVMRQAIECGEFDTIMLTHSPLDTEHVGPEILPLAAEKGIGLIIMKALGGGLLVSEGFEEGRRAGREDPLVTRCLRFVLGAQGVSCVIPGMRNADEVRQNVRVGEEFKPLSDDEFRELIQTIGRKRMPFRYDQMCLQCGYCQPCPQGVNVPEIFRAHMMVVSYPDDQKEKGRRLYDSLDVKVDDCVECRTCVEKCPAGLDVPERLKDARRAIEKG